MLFVLKNMDSLETDLGRDGQHPLWCGTNGCSIYRQTIRGTKGDPPSCPDGYYSARTYPSDIDNGKEFDKGYMIRECLTTTPESIPGTNTVFCGEFHCAQTIDLAYSPVTQATSAHCPTGFWPSGVFGLFPNSEFFVQCTRDGYGTYDSLKCGKTVCTDPSSNFPVCSFKPAQCPPGYEETGREGSTLACTTRSCVRKTAKDT